MCVLGYGGITLLVPTYLGIGRVFPDMAHTGNAGLLVVLLSGGTAGLFLFQNLFVKRDCWRDAVTFAVSLNVVCGIAAVWLGQLDLALVIAMLAIGEVLLGRLLRATTTKAVNKRPE